jgi:Protein of unknown function (DUF3593)
MFKDLVPSLISSLMSKESLFGLSLFPYLGFLWFLQQSGQAPKMVLLGFKLLLVFVVVTIPAGIYAKVAYGEELANVDWLHGSAESFLTLSNIVVVWGLSQALNVVTPVEASDSKISETSNAEAESPGKP